MNNRVASLSISLILTLLFTCFSSDNFSKEIDQEELEVTPAAVFENSDVSNWKATLPVGRNTNGIPDEYQPLQLVVNNLLPNTIKNNN